MTVVDAAAKKLRITPSAASPLAAGQSSALIVEQQVGDSEGWKEVSPDKVAWKVPDDIKNGFWTDPTENLRPTIKLPPDLKGEANLTNWASGCPVAPSLTGRTKRRTRDSCSIARRTEHSCKWAKASLFGLVDKDGHSKPATEVHWPENFDSCNHIKWEASC